MDPTATNSTCAILFCLCEHRSSTTNLSPNLYLAVYIYTSPKILGAKNASVVKLEKEETKSAKGVPHQSCHRISITTHGEMI
jgi:hypothetical protein